MLSFFISGCAISYSDYKEDRFKLFRTTTIENYTVGQVLKPDFCLAVNPYNRMVIAIKSSSQFFPFYYRQAIKGTFMMIDTYSYETLPDENGRTQYLTVPVVVPYKEFKKKLKEQPI